MDKALKKYGGKTFVLVTAEHPEGNKVKIEK